MTTRSNSVRRPRRLAAVLAALALSALGATTAASAWADGSLPGDASRVTDPQDGGTWTVIGVQQLDSSTEAAYLDGACGYKYGNGFAARLVSSGWEGWLCGPRGGDGSVTPRPGYNLTRWDLAYSCRAKYPNDSSSRVQTAQGQVAAWMPMPASAFSATADHTTDCVILQRPGSPGQEKVLLPNEVSLHATQLSAS